MTNTALDGNNLGLAFLVGLFYVVGAGLFVFALKWLSSPKTARKGVWAGEVGMLLAIVGALLNHHIVDYTWIIAGLFIGTAIGAPMAIYMPMTAAPQRTALSHAFGALAAALVGTAHYYLDVSDIPRLTMGILAFEVLLGCLTFTGSLMAFGKLQELLPSKPMRYANQNVLNMGVLVLALASGAGLAYHPQWTILFPILAVLGLAYGVLLILPIGGADMPTVISLLNSYAGLSASLMGFVLNNKLLIVAGALDGASGFILSIIMCKAMNRSFTNVLFGSFGAEAAGAKTDDPYEGKLKSTNPDEIAAIFDAAQHIVIVPGYGLAVAQAQHAVSDLAKVLQDQGKEVEYAIHPVAGRMPGHMNVLLAEADVPYDQLKEMDEINGQFGQVDVALIIGANDTVNPAARDDPKSPIAGMPILNVDHARTVIVVKRSLSPGFAGIPNPLFAKDNTLMYFADGKKAVMDLIVAVKELAS